MFTLLLPPHLHLPSSPYDDSLTNGPSTPKNLSIAWISLLSNARPVLYLFLYFLELQTFVKEQLVVACLADNYLVRCVTGQMRILVTIVVAIAVAEDILYVRCCCDEAYYQINLVGLAKGTWCSWFITLA